MPLTLNELKTIQKVVSWVTGDMPNLNWKEIDNTVEEVTKIIAREIYLKETDFVMGKKIKDDIKEGKVE